MLSRLHRFHGYGSLRRAYSNGINVRSEFIGLRITTRPKAKSYRVAVVVSRKVHKSAVVRNRIRRRIYEVVRKSDSVPIESDLIFTVFSDKLKDIDAKELNKLVEDLLIKAQQRLKSSN
jgi:ribonuclease P protein component